MNERREHAIIRVGYDSEFIGHSVGMFGLSAFSLELLALLLDDFVSDSIMDSGVSSCYSCRLALVLVVPNSESFFPI